MRTLLCLVATASAVLAQSPPTTRLIARWTADSLATADGGSIASVTDSVGGAVASQATSGKQPIMKFNQSGFNGHKVMRFRSALTSTLDIAGINIADKSTYSVFVVERPGYIDPSTNASPVSFGTGTQAVWYINNHGQFGYCCDQGDLTIPGTNVPSNASLIGMTINSGVATFHTGESTITGSASSNTGAYTVGHVGSNGAQYWASMDIAEVLIYSPAILSADLTLLKDYVNSAYGTSAARRVLVLSGNSITAGDHLLTGDLTWPEQLSDMMRSDTRIYNVGFSGQYTTDMIAAGGDAVHATPLCTSGKDVSFLWEGTNELTIHDAQVAYANMMTLAAQHKTAGCTPIIGTTIKAAQLTGGNETNRGTYNTLLLAQQLYPVIDLAALSQFSNTADTTYYYTDGTHLTYGGGTVVANAVYARVKDVGTATTNVGTVNVKVQ